MYFAIGPLVELKRILLLHIKCPWNYRHSKLDIVKYFLLGAGLTDYIDHGTFVGGWAKLTVVYLAISDSEGFTGIIASVG